MQREFKGSFTKEEPSCVKEGSVDSKPWGIAHDRSFTKQAIENVQKMSSEKEGSNLSVLCSERALETVGELDSSAVSLLARALQSFCKDLYAFLLSEFDSDFAALSDFYQDLSCPIVSIWFYRYVRRELGQPGKADSKKWQERHSKTRFSSENQVQEVCWERWLSDDYKKTIFPALARTLWDYTVSTEWRRQKENAAVPKAYMDLVVKPNFDPKKVWGTGDQQGMVFNQKGVLALTVPSLNGDLLKVVSRGIEKFHSITAHRILRWEIQTCFDQWQKGDRDFRHIFADGGYGEIAQLIGCPEGDRYQTDVKEILTAQSHCYVNSRIKCSSMIILQEGEQRAFSKPSTVSITLAPFFLPGAVFGLHEYEAKRLVPITPLPRMIGPGNTHAGQARLHFIILELFAQYSDDLFERGSIKIQPRHLALMATESFLEQSQVIKILEAWCEDSPENPAFLVRNGNEYTLSQHHEKALNFLLKQGETRVNAKKGVPPKKKQVF